MDTPVASNKFSVIYMNSQNLAAPADSSFFTYEISTKTTSIAYECNGIGSYSVTQFSVLSLTTSSTLSKNLEVYTFTYSGDAKHSASYKMGVVKNNVGNDILPSVIVDASNIYVMGTNVWSFIASKEASPSFSSISYIYSTDQTQSFMSTAFSTPFGTATTQDAKDVPKESKAAVTSVLMTDSSLLYTMVTTTI